MTKSFWLTQKLMAELFQTTKQNISLHIQNIYNEGELPPEATVKEYLTVQKEGDRQVSRTVDFYKYALIYINERVKNNLQEKNGDILTYQIFIEPKGKHLKEHDKWKQVFLKEISEKYKGKTLDFITLRKTQKYRLVGVPFYNNEDENEFKQSLYEVIEN